MSRWLAIALFLLVTIPGAGAAEIIIVNMDGPNEGLNDPTLRTPSGDNPGTTLGELRRNAVAYAAAVLASRLQIAVPVRVAVSFEAQYCSHDNAVIGAGGTQFLVRDFPGAPRPDILYPIALANSLAGQRLDVADKPYSDIVVTFSSSLDNRDQNCLGGARWYYGLNNDAPGNDINFLINVVHEIIHGLGFQSFVHLHTGQFGDSGKGTPRPDIYSAHIQDLSLVGQPYWPELDARQRAASATHTGAVVWAPRGSSNTSNAVARLTDGVRSGRVQLYAPSPLLPGSSISHFSDQVRPSQFMGPFENGATVREGLGLAMCILQDIGWQLNGHYCPDDTPVPRPRPDADYASVRFVTAGAADSGRSPGATAGDTDNGPDDDSGDDPGKGSVNKSHRGSSGGCSLSPNAAFDPILVLLVLLATGVLVWRGQLARAN